MLTDGDVNIIVGPSNSGKSTAALYALQDRSGVFYLPFREIGDNGIANRLALEVGYSTKEGMYAEVIKKCPGKVVELQLVLDVLEQALQESRVRQLEPNAKEFVTPIFIVDDVHWPLQDGKFPSDVKHFLAWLLGMHNRGLLLFKMLSCEDNIVPVIQTSISGMSARGRPKTMEYIPVGAVQTYIKQQLPSLVPKISAVTDLDEISAITDLVGGHLGDIGRVIANLKYPPPNITSSVHLKDMLNGIIDDDKDKMMVTVIARDNMETYDEVTHVSNGVFTLLEKSPVVNLSEVLKHVNVPAKVLDRVVDGLVRQNLLSYKHTTFVTFHSPHQRGTWLQVKQDPYVKVRIDTANALFAPKK